MAWHSHDGGEGRRARLLRAFLLLAVAVALISSAPTLVCVNAQATGFESSNAPVTSSNPFATVREDGPQINTPTPQPTAPTSPPTDVPATSPPARSVSIPRACNYSPSPFACRVVCENDDLVALEDGPDAYTTVEIPFPGCFLTIEHSPKLGLPSTLHLDALTTIPAHTLELRGNVADFQLYHLLQRDWASVERLRVSTRLISDFNITPDLFINLTSLKELFVANRNVPGVLAFFPKYLPPTVTHISIEKNEIDAIDLDGVFYPRLERLFIFDNPLMGLPANISLSFPALSHVELQGIQATGHTAIFYPLGRLQNLTDLTVRNTNIRTFSSNSFDGFSNLRVLALTSCFINFLPDDAFAHLTNLEYLRLSSNFLRVLPPSLLQHSPKLLEVEFQANQLVSVPATLFANTPNLEGIFLDNNRLTHLPKTLLSGATNLRLLHISHNLITTLPERFFSSTPLLIGFTMDANRITSFPGSLLSPLINLEEVLLSRNELKFVPRTMFEQNTRLVHLSMRENRITAIEPGALSSLSLLRDLELGANQLTVLTTESIGIHPLLNQFGAERNRITHVEPGMFELFTSLSSLSIGSNKLTALGPNFLQGATSLRALHCAHNRITFIHPSAFTSLTNLRVLNLAGNLLASVPASLIQAQQSILLTLTLHDNRLTQLPPGMLDNLPALRRVELYHNRLTSLSSSLSNSPNLIHLDITFNSIASLPDDFARSSTALEFVFVEGNPLRALPPVLLANSGSLSELSVGNFNGPPLAAEDVLPQQLGSLTRLDAENVVLTEDDLRARNVSRLMSLTLGWRGAKQHGLSFENICDFLADSVEVLEIVDTCFSDMRVCLLSSVSIRTLNIGVDPCMRFLTLGSSLALNSVNVSSNPLLTEVSMNEATLFDISRTSMTFSNDFCSRHGTRAFFAAHMLTEALAPFAASLINKCLGASQLIDLSGNHWLNDLRIWNALTTTVVYRPEEIISGDFFDFSDGQLLPARDIVPVLELTGIPIACDVALHNIRTSHLFDAQVVHAFSVAYSFECTCAQGFASSGSECTLQTLSAAQLAGIVTGSVLVGLFIWPLLLFAYKKHKQRQAYQAQLESYVELQEHLLSKRDEEVQLLKQAWEISPTELTFVDRIDKTSAGAFGEVWRCQWETLTVAVKVLKLSFVELDPETISEFGKEVEFLRRTRHPNVVRFFGAGQLSSGCPFLVLELVPLGALSTLLWEHRLQDILQERIDARLREQSTSSSSPRYSDGQSSSSEQGKGTNAAVLTNSSVTSLALSNRNQEARGASIVSAYLRMTRRQPLEEGSSSKSDSCKGYAHSAVDVDLDQDQEHESLMLCLWDLKVQLLADVAKGMQFIHSLGEIHRDLKSGNVLVSANLHAKITDFGSIRSTLQSSTAAHQAPSSSRVVGGHSMRGLPSARSEPQKRSGFLNGLRRKLSMRVAGPRGPSQGNQGGEQALVMNPIYNATSSPSQPPQLLSDAVDKGVSPQKGSESVPSSRYEVHADDITVGSPHMLATTRTLLPMDSSRDLNLTALVGTPLYMAPEVMRGDVYGPSADVFSFSIIMWEVAFEEVPDLVKQIDSDLKGSALTFLMHLVGGGTRLSLDRAEELKLPQWYLALIKRCWDGDVSQRPSFRRIVSFIADNTAALEIS